MTIEQNIERIANALEQLVELAGKSLLFIPSKGSGMGWSTPNLDNLDSQQSEAVKCEGHVAAPAKRTRAKKAEAPAPETPPLVSETPDETSGDAPAGQPETPPQEPEDKEAADALRREVVSFYQSVSKRFPEFKKDYEKFRDGKTVNTMTFAELKAAQEFITNYGDS